MKLPPHDGLPSVRIAYLQSHRPAQETGPDQHLGGCHVPAVSAENNDSTTALLGGVDKFRMINRRV